MQWKPVRTGSRVISMVLHSAYAPVLPEMDPFLFASVGEEVGGIPLSVLSALAQLGLDPRNEAARWSNLTSEAAASQLGRLFARLPDRPWISSEIRGIASTLVRVAHRSSRTFEPAQPPAVFGVLSGATQNALLKLKISTKGKISHLSSARRDWNFLYLP
jgi:hypothetical protein